MLHDGTLYGAGEQLEAPTEAAQHWLGAGYAALVEKAP